MSIAIRIPEALHKAIPTDIPASSLIRRMLEQAGERPETLVVAFTSRIEFVSPQPTDVKRYMIYLTDEEKVAATGLADRFLISLNQLIQILLEDALYRAGLWPPASGKAEKSL